METANEKKHKNEKQGGYKEIKKKAIRRYNEEKTTHLEEARYQNDHTI